MKTEKAPEPGANGPGAYDEVHAPSSSTETSTEPLSNWIGSALFRAFARLWRGIEAALEPLGIRNPHFWILFALEEHGPMSQVGLMKRVSADRTTMVRLIDDLERLGLAEREKDRKDRRANAVRLTAHGEEVLAQGKRRMAESEAEFLKGLTGEERERLRNLLQRVADDK
jgi:DNA-binding MarR family transcriptional regulator